MFKINRKTLSYVSTKSPDDEIVDMLKRISETHPRWGFGLMSQRLKNLGYGWNHKRIYRVYCEMALNLRIKPKKRFPSRNPEHLCVPSMPNETWSIDFMHDSLNNGRSFRTFNVIDDYNRESLAIEVDFSLPSERVIRVLNRLILERGKPRKIRMDNGPEFISSKLADWSEDHRVNLEHTKPGTPTQNAYVERFNRTFRGEVLDFNIFESIEDAQWHATDWSWKYNNIRPHKSLGGKPPRGLCSAGAEGSMSLL